MRTKTKRRNLSFLKKAIRECYAWPGGHRLSAITFDGAALCMDCCKKNWHKVCYETMIPGWESCGWGVQAVDVLWEGGNYCDQCSTNLDAYPSNEKEEEDEE